jgi:hypothetical protein
MSDSDLSTGGSDARPKPSLTGLTTFFGNIGGLYTVLVPLASGLVFVFVVWRAGLLPQIWRYFSPSSVTTRDLAVTLDTVRAGDLSKLRAQIPAGLAFAPDGSPLPKADQSSLGYLVNFSATVVGVCACQVYYSMTDMDTVQVVTGTTAVGNITSLGKESTAALQFFVAGPRAKDGTYLNHKLKLTLTIDWTKPPDQNVGQMESMLPAFDVSAQMPTAGGGS